MTAQLAQVFNLQHMNPSNRDDFFDDDQDKIIRDFVKQRECQDHTAFPPTCNVSLFLGMFFDGTNNNLERDEPNHTNSNVARLYRAFPRSAKLDGPKQTGWRRSKEYDGYKQFLPSYIPGVGTEFKDVGDTGKGQDRTLGLASAYLGENRIIWALVRAINVVYFYYTDDFLIGDEEFKKSFNRLTLPDFGDTTATPDYDEQGNPLAVYNKFKQKFTDALQRLHQSLERFVPIGKGKSAMRGVVTDIYFSVFGFSRGAVMARVYANWFMWLCKLDADIAGQSGASLGTIPVTFDFMGLFDSVASVGLAESAPIFGAHGHYNWANAATSLKVPTSGPAHCLHLVSGHELRRSFPVDSVLSKGSLPQRCEEIVFPGVHSDIGGGYAPKEQGRGKDGDGSDMLSRITLATMYRAARLAGVPIKLEDAPESVIRGFMIDEDLIKAFNAYIRSCAKPDTPEGESIKAPLHEIMAQQHQLYILWRKKMLGKMTSLPSYEASDAHDQLDIKSADEELKREVAQFEEWRRWQKNPPAFNDEDNRRPFAWPEWSTIDRYWDDPIPSPAITNLFDQFVHDSRAWFKPLGKDIPDLQADMEALIAREEAVNEWDGYSEPRPVPLAPYQKTQIIKYKQYRDAGKVREGLTPESKGREDQAFMKGGFLRYRKIFMGSDDYKPHGAVYAGLKMKNAVA